MLPNRLQGPCPSSKLKCLGLILFISSLVFSLPLRADAAPVTAVKANALAPSSSSRDESLDSPRYMWRQFLEVIKRDDLDGAFNLVEFPRHRMSSEAKRRLVRQLIEVLNKRGRVDATDLSGLPEGKVADTQQRDLEIIGSVRVKGETVPLTLLRIDDGGRKLWRFTPEFMQLVPKLAEDLEESDIEAALPPALAQYQFMGIKAWQWVGLGLVFTLALFVSGGLALLLLRLMEFVRRRFKVVMTDQALKGFIQPLKLLIGLLVFHFGSNQIELNLAVRQLLFNCEAVLTIVAVTFLLLRCIEALIDMIRLSFDKQGRSGSMAMLPPVQKAAKILVIVISLVLLLRNLGFDVTAIVAGLGVGGLAIALAGQKTIENLFGGISIILDQPVRVGDSGRFGEIIGTVEDIGLRSTRVRTLDRSIVTIPNAEFSHMKLENYEKRDKLRWKTTLMIRPETQAEQMQLLLIQIKELLLSHPLVHKDPTRVRFANIGPSALEIDIFAYTRTTDWSEHLMIVEDLNLRLLQLVQGCGTSLAFPSSAIHSVRGDGIDVALQQEAAKKIQELKESGAWPLPSYPTDWIESRSDTLKFWQNQKDG